MYVNAKICFCVSADGTNMPGGVKNFQGEITDLNSAQTKKEMVKLAIKKVKDLKYKQLENNGYIGSREIQEKKGNTNI